MPDPSPFSTKLSWRDRLFPQKEWILLLLLAAEALFFGLTANRFWSSGNAFEVVRLAVEIGLLAIALTPVIVTGGIDLSVGSLLGLCAVVFGALWRDGGFSPGAAALVAVVAGVAGGSLNALLITRFRIPPLIVTLGTYSLFRGLAEGLTGGLDSYANFPASFLFWGQGAIARVPAQAFVLAASVIGFGLLMHRTVIGRSLFAIGYSPAGAVYAGLPVNRRLALVYVLSGLSAGVAALLYVAHLGQAKADAGTGYELTAITAVVLGGTSIFGGRGTILGTVLGLFAIVTLQNGLRLAGLPAELTGIMTGVLLLVTICADRLSGSTFRAASPTAEGEELEVKNSQVAVLSAVILASGLIVAASNWWLVNSLHSDGRSAGTTAAAKATVVAMMPKAKGDPYFASCKVGAEQAAKELGVDLLWDGPTELDAAKQNEVVEAWITRGVNTIAVSVENRDAISTVLRKARQAGIKVVTWDADAAPDARDFLINQATAQGIGETLADEAGRILHEQGEFAIVTGALSAANQNEWMKFIRARIAEKHPGLKLVTVRPCDDDRDRAFAETQTILKVYPQVKLVMGIAAPAVPGAAEAVKQSGRKDVQVTGLSLPNMCKPYIHAGVVSSIVLWNTRDLGYLTVYASDALARGTLKAGDTSLAAGRLGTIKVIGDNVMLGAPFVFNAGNIDKFDF